MDTSNKIVFSIIIPHYDIPNLLVRCLQSVPVREDIQVIVVDDCSPDADTYQERFPEFSRPYLEWYSTPQGGSAGRARNIGLEHAKGKWVLFADADDFFTDKLMPILEKYKQSKCDVIHFKADSVDTISLQPSKRQKDRNASIDAYFHGDVSAREAALWHTVVWAQMISRKYIEEKQIRFDEILVANDVMFAAKLACLTENIQISNEVLYVITTRENSLHDSKFKNVDRFVIHIQTQLHFVRYIRDCGVRRQKLCMFNTLKETYRNYGMSGAGKMLKMALQEHALFYGLGEYLCRKVKRNAKN